MSHHHHPARCRRRWWGAYDESSTLGRRVGVYLFLEHEPSSCDNTSDNTSDINTWVIIIIQRAAVVGGGVRMMSHRPSPSPSSGNLGVTPLECIQVKYGKGLESPA
jgi:hypothetical protein